MNRFHLALALFFPLGRLTAEPSHQTQSSIPVPQLEAYDNWKMARPDSSVSITQADTIQALEGFSVELIHSAAAEEGSWISMAFGDSGQLYFGIEEKGILELTFSQPNTGSLPTVENIALVEDTLEECRGLLWAYDSLYANANNSRGFYRLQDTTGDGLFDYKPLLLSTVGGVGHGRNQLRLGPDGFIYLVHGNHPRVDTETPLPPTSRLCHPG